MQHKVVKSAFFVPLSGRELLALRSTRFNLPLHEHPYGDDGSHREKTTHTLLRLFER